VEDGLGSFAAVALLTGFAIVLAVATAATRGARRIARHENVSRSIVQSSPATAGAAA